ncbi:MAG: hypothetical protein COV99_02335, partial [Bacteroidetes bacterium CG12_big_fil_rev_8_21_14_0_65_60_17]
MKRRISPSRNRVLLVVATLFGLLILSFLVGATSVRAQTVTQVGPTLSGQPTGLTVFDGKIYYSLSHNLHVMNLDGSGNTQLSTFVSGKGGQLRGVATNGLTIHGASNVWDRTVSWNPDGSDAKVVLSGGGMNNPVDVAVDGNFVYAADFGNGIFRGPLSGGSPNVHWLAVTGASAVAVSGGFVYITEGTNLHRSNLDGTGLVTLDTGLTTPIGGLSVAQGKIYVSNSGLNQIISYNLDGTGKTVVATLGATPGAIEAVGTEIFVSLGNTISRFTVTTEQFDDLIVNGTFETGNFIGNVSDDSFDGEDDGWTVVSGGEGHLLGWQVTTGVDWHNTIQFSPLNNGTHVVDLNGTGGPGRILQTIPTQNGRTYRLRFETAGPSTGNGFPNPRPIRVTHGATTTDINTPHSPEGSLVWQQNSIDFTATGASTEIAFQSLNGNGFWGTVVDNVSVEELPTVTLGIDITNLPENPADGTATLTATLSKTLS